MVRKLGESSRDEDQLDEFAAHARSADERWAEIPREVKEATRRAGEAGELAAQARARRAQTLFETQQAEGALHAHQIGLAQLASTVQEVASEAERAHLAEEEAAEREQARRLEELRAVEENAREAEARRMQLAHEREQFEDAAREAASAAARAREEEEAAREERLQRMQDARAAHEALLAAEARTVEAVERANRLAELAADAAQRKQEAYDEEKVALTKLARNILEARRAQVRTLTARARRLSIGRERQESLRRIEASRRIEHIPGDRRAPVPDSSAPYERGRRGPGAIKGGQVQTETADIRVVLADVRKPHPVRITEHPQVPSPPPSRRKARWKPWIIPLVTLVLVAVSFSVLSFLPAEEVQRPSSSPLPEESAPADQTPPPAGPVVPELSGVSIWEARDRLLQADLALDGVIPTPGPPGIVVSADPAPGRVVPAGTAVTVYVGVDPERLHQERESTGTDQAPPRR